VDEHKKPGLRDGRSEELQRQSEAPGERGPASKSSLCLSSLETEGTEHLSDLCVEALLITAEDRTLTFTVSSFSIVMN
jgi:hypothetical protein